MAYARPGVYVSERLLPATIPAGASANSAGAVVASFAQGPEAPTLVTSWYEFTKIFGGYNASYVGTFQVASFFANGGRELFVKRLLPFDATTATTNLVTSGSAVVATVTSKNAGTDGNNLRIVVTAGTVASTYTLEVYKESGISNNITDDILLERYENVVFNDPTSSDYAETVVNLVSPNITISGSTSGTIVSNTYPLSGGGNGSPIAATDYTAYKGGTSSVFEDLSSINRPLVLFLPNVNSLPSTGPATVINVAIAWAEANDGFVVLTTGENQAPDAALDTANTYLPSSNAAVYYPRLYIADPLGRGSGSLRKISPAGAVAGLYLATDTSRGVFKAPAGITANLQGIVSVERSFTSTELDNLNIGKKTNGTITNKPINPIRNVPGAGLVVMGARTLKQDGTANKYVNMRRSLIYIEKNLKDLTQFAIFENNNERLWSQIRTTIEVFLNEYRNQGGLRGNTPSQAFFVKCDAENNSAQQIANGEVHIQVGVALQYPAEFIVIDLSQKTLN